MTVKVINEQDVLYEAVEVLLERLSPAKVARLIAAWQVGSGDYLAIREQLFAEETVTTLFEEIQEYQAQEGRTDHG